MTSIFWQVRSIESCCVILVVIIELVRMFLKCGALHDLVPFVQFKKREKHPWRSVNFSKVAGFSLQLKLTLLHGCFSRFLNCKNCTKLRNASQICFAIAMAIASLKILLNLFFNKKICLQITPGTGIF